MFVLNSDITIGQFRFSGVLEVKIKRSIHSVVELATIKVPAIAKVVRNGRQDISNIVTGKQFKEGDKVLIKLGYNGNLKTEFSGFVRSIDQNMPLTIQCEGYSWLLRRVAINRFENSVSVKSLLENIVSELPGEEKLSVICENVGNLCNIDLANHSGFDVIQDVLKYTDGGLQCFFLRPELLWCGYLYKAYANGHDILDIGNVDYRLGYNIPEENALSLGEASVGPVQVKYNKKLSDGRIINATAGDARFTYVHNRLLNHIQDAGFLKNLAEEKATSLNYRGYEGFISTFLEPYVCPGYVARVQDDIHIERSGRYLVESTELTFGVNGARRKIELGIRLDQ